MYKISEQLKEEIKLLNSTLLNKYEYISKIDKNRIRSFIEPNIGDITNMKKMSKNELKQYYKKGGIVGVDGSKNRMGGASPHFIEIFQGLSINSAFKDSPIYKADFYTPLYLEREKEILDEMKEGADKDEYITNYKLSGIEVDVALESLKKFKPFAIMMDGSLIRYDIECFDKWIKLRKECEKQGVILIGVIKDIKTSIIGQKLLEQRELNIKECFHDRELLYGVLDYGEMIKIKSKVGKKSQEGFSSVFLRTSADPNVIGMDILDSQKEYIDEMARLVFSLTPSNSRGVPLWLDIVDSEVKISNKMIRGLLESYLDRGLLEKFFISERDKRTL